MKKYISTVLCIGFIAAGVSLLLYPTVSDWWNAYHQSRAIAIYTEAVEGMDEEIYQTLWDEACRYNERLKHDGNHYRLTKEEREEYEALLDVSGSGVMGYVEIPRINCRLPIYHGTDEAVLQVAVGHLAGSALPVGGEGTHCVLSGHRGLPSAKLFTDLDQMEEGDLFMLYVLGETLTYEVDEIQVVLPEEVESLEPAKGEDYCTLVTCTPYGINTHRLLVRGHRRENLEEDSTLQEAAGDGRKQVRIETALWAAIGVMILAAILTVFIVQKKKKSTQK